MRKVWLHSSVLSLVLIALVAMTGCGGTKADEAFEDYQLSVTLDKSVYRPGEALLATVTLSNNTNESIDMPELDAKSVVFWFGRINDPEKMERQAVTSSKEPKGRVRPVPAGDTVKRQFVLTTLTHYTGPLSLQAHFNPEIPLLAREIPKIYSNTLQYDVSGPVLFDRDGAGFIQKSEAIGLARAKANQEVTAADAIFVEDEMGYYKCWVNLKVADDKYVSYLVDPYIGRVWRDSKPFNPALLKDKRRDPSKERRNVPGAQQEGSHTE